LSRKRFLIILAAFVVAFAALGLFSFARLPFGGSVFQYAQSFQASDFVGTWINLVPPTHERTHPDNTSVISHLFISDNQGTYTVDAHRTYYFYQNGGVQQGDYDFGTTTMTVNPPDAHAFVTFQQGSLDMRLQLLSQSSMRIVESLHTASEGQITTSQETEQFTKIAGQTSSSMSFSAAYLPSSLTPTSRVTPQWRGLDFTLSTPSRSGYEEKRVGLI
jgi:hypothetical protein